MVGEALGDAASASSFLCSADELRFDAPARALAAEEALQPGWLSGLHERKGPRPEPPSGCVLGPANPSNSGVLGPENMSPSSSPEEETPSSTEVEEHPSSRPISTTAATADVCSPLKAKSLQRKSRVAPVSLSATKLRTCSFIQYIVQQFLAKFQLFSNCFLQSSEICFKSVMLPLDS
ncbi:hypothetical protein CFC21_016633 [Triticum aestivum]|uniref:Uncharacterized protein n=1 Tax=Triticum aestivum TaxID=4565 RepID=A0A9R1DZ49_WHEAT|nr:hypothetical protein CFC21_016633 [Triticum aestivum]